MRWVKFPSSLDFDELSTPGTLPSASTCPRFHLPSLLLHRSLLATDSPNANCVGYVATAWRALLGKALTSIERVGLVGRVRAAVDADEALQEELAELGLLDGAACMPQFSSAVVRAAGRSAATLQSRTGSPQQGSCGGRLIVLVRRAGSTRRLAREFEKSIIAMIQSAGEEEASGRAAGATVRTASAGEDENAGTGAPCHLRLAVYDADAGHSPMAVLALFAAAQGIIAPHGAGLANLVAARPGVHVLEFHPSEPRHAASGIPGLNLCMLHLSRALGLAYTGAVMRPVEGELDPLSSEPIGTAWAGDVDVVRRWVRTIVEAPCG